MSNEENIITLYKDVGSSGNNSVMIYCNITCNHPLLMTELYFLADYLEYKDVNVYVTYI